MKTLLIMAIAALLSGCASRETIPFSDESWNGGNISSNDVEESAITIMRLEKQRQAP